LYCYELSWIKEARILLFCQMLDGQEKTLEVSQMDCRPSPSKKQKTLVGFLKRPSASTSAEEGMPST
jgi:SWI/SNF-related matrix-associated actin-dependent regulator of chromatin subfamily A-like protein 1